MHLTRTCEQTTGAFLSVQTQAAAVFSSALEQMRTHATLLEDMAPLKPEWETEETFLTPPTSPTTG